MKIFEVKEDGIYKNDYVVIGGETNKEYTQLATNVMPKEIFIEAFEKYIWDRLDCYDESACGGHPILTFKSLKEREKQ